jgi:RHS repeat-associated protein
MIPSRSVFRAVLTMTLALLTAQIVVAVGPTISTLTPNTGAVGASVTIAGSGFGNSQGSSTVKFNGTTATATSWSASSIVVTVPTGATTGSVVVTVSNKASNGVTFTVLPAPSISSLSVTSGAVGAAVTISGSNFGSTQGTSTVKFNGTTATVSSWTATAIGVTVPSGATTGNVVVHASGVDSNGVSFTVLPTPGISSLSITTGAIGAAVTISGSNFGSTQGTSTVKFNGTTATVSSWSAASIGVIVPSGASTGNVVVHASGVDSNGVSFTVVSAPSISSLSITSGAVGAAVTITGTNLGSPGTVTFNGTTAATTSWTATSIATTVPSGATNGNLVVLASGVASNGINFTVLATPNISGISPTSGHIGDAVTISGTGFGATQGSGTASFNGTQAAVTSWSATSIAVTVPTGATTGNVVVNASGVASNGVNFTVSTLPSPWLDQDIGSPGAAGSGNFASGVFTVQGSGGGFGGGSTGDSFNFAYQPMTGDGSIVARVATVSNGLAQAGVMMRETLTPGSTTMFMSYWNTAGHLYYRTTTGAGMNTTGSTAGVPYWYKVTRSGSTFAGYVSIDGFNWVLVGTTESINMASTIYVGLAVSSQNSGTLYTATFDGVSVNSTASPAPSITTLSATEGPVGTQVVVTGQNFGSTQGNSVVWLHGAATTINAWSATSITLTIPTGATSGDLIVSVAPTMNDSNPVEFTVTSNPLPTGWLDQDVGTVQVQGSSSYSNGVFTVLGSGNDYDSSHFAYRALTGDGTIIARLSSVNNTYSWGGVMIRDGLFEGAKSILVCQCNGGGSEIVYRALTGTNLSTITTGSSFVGTPMWFKLVRTGSDFVAYLSNDGISWTPYGGSIPIGMAQTAYFGVITSSNSVGGGNSLATATFDSVSVSPAGTQPPLISSLSATTGPVGTQVIIAGSGFGASQGASTVALNNSPVTVSLWSDTSIAITIPSGATSGGMVVLRAPNMDSSNAVAYTVTTTPLLSGWLDTDIGRVWQPGSASYSGGVYTINGAGSAGGSADALHFAFQQISTDFTIVARLTSLTTGTYGGVMVRETLDGNSPNAATYVYPYGNPAYWSEFAYRTVYGGTVSTPAIAITGLPCWVKIVRASNTFASFASYDGVSWTQIGATQTIQTTQTVYVGLATTKGSGLGTATFDNVSISLGGSLPNPKISGISPISGAPGTLVTISGSGFGSIQSTSNAYFNGVASTSIYSWTDTSIQAVVPDSATTGPVSVVVGNITGTGPNFTILFTASVTDSLNNQTTYKSSLFGGQWAFTNSQGSGCSTCTVRGTIQNEYDNQGNLVWSIDPLGYGALYRYDSSHNLIWQEMQGDTNTANSVTSYTYNSFGEPLTVTDPLGNVTTNTYDAHGNLKTVTTPKPNSNTAASVTQFGYNTLGQLTAITDPLNHVTTLTYTPAGLIQTITDFQNNVTTYGYDSHGNRTSVLDALNHQTAFAYDAGDRLTTITYPDTTTTTFGYDYRGRRTTITDQNGKITAYAYDDADRLTSVSDASTPANVTTYVYDTENNLTSITDANNNQTVFAYDAYGRVKQTNFPSTQIETYQYDADNNLISKTDRKNQTIQYVYDVLNRMTRKIYPDSTEADYVYDLAGKIQQVNDPTGTYAFAYDNMGRLTGTTTNYSFLTSRSFTTSYGYDAASNRTGFTDPESGSTAYVYDTLNRLQTLTPPVAFSSGSFGFGYDGLNRRTSLTRPNNVTTNYGYDNLSHLTSVLHQLSGSTIDGASYTLDNAGNRTAKTDQRTAVATSYGYDNIYQLLSATQGATATEGYTYDPVGNRLSSLGVSSYTNNSSNELTATSSASYGYDNNGNAVTKNDSTGITTYGWDYENRLTSVTLPGSGGTVSFKYDPFGRRIYKSSISGTSIFAYDGDNLVEETNSSGTAIARYSQGLNTDEPLAMLRSSATSFYQSDGLGSVTSLSSGAGSLAQTYSFDSFGKTTPSGSLVNPFQYTAREFDSETGLYFNRARYLDPTTGRFLSEDPTGFKAGVNFYPYVTNDPVNQTDPMGFDSDSQFCRRLLEKIENVRKNIQRRIGQLDENPLNLPETCPGPPSLSKAGHRMLINMDKALLASLEATYAWRCKDKPPSPPVPVPVPADTTVKAGTAVSVGVIIYYIISEGSRLFPPRNLIPIP